MLTITFAANDLRNNEPDKLADFANQQTYTFGDDVQIPDTLNDSLEANSANFCTATAYVTFGHKMSVISGTNLVILGGIAYPISFDGTYFTITIDMSQYPQSRHANITNITSINEPTALKIYPNPATTMLNFSFPVSASTTIKSMDITGRTISQQFVNNTTGANIKIDGYAKGMYLFRITTDGKTESGKFIIE